MNKLTPVLDQWMTSRLEGIHTCVPGKVESYDPEKRMATVQPSIRLRMDNGISVEIPPIAGVPVMFPTTAAFNLDYPLAQGDSVLIMFSEASMGNWLNTVVSSMVDAEDSTRFSLTDAICIPGLYPFQQVPRAPVTIRATTKGELELVTDMGSTVKLDALLSLGNQAGSVKALLDDVWSEVMSTVTNLNTWGAQLVGVPPGPPRPMTTADMVPLVTAMTAQLVSIATKMAKVSLVLK